MDSMADAKDHAGENSISDGDLHKSIPVSFTIIFSVFLTNTEARWELRPSLHFSKV